MTGIPRIRIEPLQPALTDFRAVLNTAVQVRPHQASVSQRNLVLINCAEVGSPLEVRIVRILTLEANGRDGGHPDTGSSREEIPQRETWYWFLRSPDDFPDAGGREPGIARDGAGAGSESRDGHG